jgi:hypothetical protein
LERKVRGIWENGGAKPGIWLLSHNPMAEFQLSISNPAPASSSTPPPSIHKLLSIYNNYYSSLLLLSLLLLLLRCLEHRRRLVRSPCCGKKKKPRQLNHQPNNRNQAAIATACAALETATHRLSTGDPLLPAWHTSATLLEAAEQIKRRCQYQQTKTDLVSEPFVMRKFY